MSVQTELDRLNAAKNSLKTAIEGKGVAVPDGTKLDGYSTLVEQIGGGDSNVVVVEFPGLTQDSPKSVSQDKIETISSNDIVSIKIKDGYLIPKVSQNEETIDFAIVQSENLFLHAILNLSRKTIFLLENKFVFIPTSSSSDNGKFLQVVDGVPAWQSLPIYNGEVE